MYESVGMVRHLYDSDRFYVTIDTNYPVFFLHDHAEDMLYNDSLCPLYKDHYGDVHSVARMFLSQSGKYIAIEFNRHKYLVRYRWFVRMLQGAAAYAEITRYQAPVPDLLQVWQAVTA